jgi:hypothetical protein
MLDVGLLILLRNTMNHRAPFDESLQTHSSPNKTSNVAYFRYSIHADQHEVQGNKLNLQACTIAEYTSNLAAGDRILIPNFPYRHTTPLSTP